MVEPLSREQINELLRQQERELPLRQMQPAADSDEAERTLRREWRQRRERRQERRQEPERCGQDWNAWCDQRIAIALAAEREAHERERKAFVHQLQDVFGEALAKLLHDLRTDLHGKLSGFTEKVTALEAVWRTSLNESAVEIAQLQQELSRLKASHNSICVDLARPPLQVQ